MPRSYLNSYKKVIFSVCTDTIAAPHQSGLVCMTDFTRADIFQELTFESVNLAITAGSPSQVLSKIFSTNQIIQHVYSDK